MEEEYFKKQVLPEVYKVDPIVKNLMPKFVDEHKITGSIYDKYVLAYAYPEDVIGSFREDLPEQIKAVLVLGFELAKERAKTNVK